MGIISVGHHLGRMRAAQVLITCLIAAAHGYPAAQSGSGSGFDPEDPLTRFGSGYGSGFDPEDPLTRFGPGSGSGFDPEDPLTRFGSGSGSSFDPEDPLTRFGSGYDYSEDYASGSGSGYAY